MEHTLPSFISITVIKRFMTDEQLKEFAEKYHAHKKNSKERSVSKQDIAIANDIRQGMQQKDIQKAKEIWNKLKK